MALTDTALELAEALHQPARSPQRDYLRKRGLTTETIERFSLGYSAEYDGITVPFQTVTGKVVMLKVRRLGNQKPKYLTVGHDFPLPMNTHLFNVHALRNPGTLVICEGEFDAMILTQLGIPAVGIPGVSTWQDHWALLLPARSVLLMDPDDAGTRAAFDIQRRARDYGKSLAIGKLEDGDVTEAFVRGGGEDAIKEAISSAQ